MGRDLEIAAVRERLGAGRVVTLTGPGGCGKTRLALRVAALAADGFEDGAWLVELASLTDAALVPASPSPETLGVPEQDAANPLAAVARALAGRDLLIVLDNCEHVLGPAAQVVVTRAPPSHGDRYGARRRDSAGAGVTVGGGRRKTASMTPPPPASPGTRTGNRETRRRAPVSDHPVAVLLAGSSLPSRGVLVPFTLPDPPRPPPRTWARSGWPRSWSSTATAACAPPPSRLPACAPRPRAPAASRSPRHCATPCSPRPASCRP